MAKNENKKWIVSWLIAAALTVGFVLYLGKRYALLVFSPDDLAMKSIISGVFTGTPDGHSVFMRYPLSWLLSQLYRIWAGVDWYDLFFMGCHGWCVWLIFARCGRMTGKKIPGYLVWALAAVVFLFTNNMVNLEWTTTAGALGMTAIFRYCTMPEYRNRKQAAAEYGVCFALLAVGFCLRHTAILMLVPIAFVCWVSHMLAVRKKAEYVRRKTWISETVFLLAAGILVVAVMGLHSLGYRSDEWKSYLTYTEDRSALFDYYGYPDYSEYQAEYEAAGISYEVYVLMTNDYNYVVAADHFENIDLHAMAVLAEELYNQQDAQARWEKCGRKLDSLLKDDAVVWMLRFLAVLAFAHIFLVDRKQTGLWLCALGAVVCTVGVGGYLIYQGRFPARVALCLLYGVAAVLAGNVFAISVENGEQSRRRVVLKWLVAVAVAVAVCCQITAHQDRILEKNNTQAALAQAANKLAQYCNQEPENLYFYDFWSFSQRGNYFMKTVDSGNYVRAGGWLYRTPVYDEMLNGFGCYDLVQAIRERGNVYYLVSSSRVEQVSQRLNDYFASIGQNISVELADSFETSVEYVEVLHFRYVG